MLSYKAPIQVNLASTTLTIWSTLSTTTSTETDRRFTTYGEANSVSNLGSFAYTANASAGVTVTTQTTYNILLKSSVAGTLYLRGENAQVTIEAKNAYL